MSSPLLLPSLAVNPLADESASSSAPFYQIVKAEWDKKKHLLKYDPSVAVDRVIPGKFKFVAQLNPARFNKRPTEFKMDRVVNPFDPTKFNFTKAFPEESLFQLQSSHGSGPLYELDASPSPLKSAATDVLMINISPIGPSHLLFLPMFQETHAQVMHAGGLRRALELLALIRDRSFRLGFNSFGAYASVNHLHFQGYENPFPMAIELTAFEPLAHSPSGVVTLLRSTEYPVRLLEVRSGSVQDLGRAAEVVAGLCKELEARNQPYNLYLVDGGLRAFIVPQRFEAAKINGEVPDDLIATCMNPACFEIAGHILMKRQEDFDSFDEDTTCRLLAHCSLSEQEFSKVQQLAIGLLAKA